MNPTKPDAGVDPGEGYYILDRGEPPKEGDEHIYPPDDLGWMPSHNWQLDPPEQGEDLIYRRKLPATPAVFGEPHAVFVEGKFQVAYPREVQAKVYVSGFSGQRECEIVPVSIIRKEATPAAAGDGADKSATKQLFEIKKRVAAWLFNSDLRRSTGEAWTREQILDVAEMIRAELAPSTALQDENQRLRAALEEIQLPWPIDVWTMTVEQYVAAVPDEDQRTAISGLLMRMGWQVAMVDDGK